MSSIITLAAKDPPQDLSLPEYQLTVFLPRLGSNVRNEAMEDCLFF